MKRIIDPRLGWLLLVMLGLVTGYSLNWSSSIFAQRGSPDGLPPPPEWKSPRPAPWLVTKGNLTLWPNQRADGTYWSIGDIRKAHQVLADAEQAGKTVDPNSTLHDFPYWTRTHSMFIYHVPVKTTGKTAQQHMGYAQFVVIMGGKGTAIAGGQLQQMTTLTEGGRQIPGELRGAAITGGDTFQVKEGDFLSVPPNTPLQFKTSVPGGLTYMTTKINAGLYPWDLIR